MGRAFSIIPAHAVAALARQVRDICIQDKEVLLSVARTLAFYGEYEEAQVLLWRGVRLYGEDRDVWEHALRTSLERLLSCASFVEWQQAYYRLQYIAAGVPLDIRHHPDVTPYLLFCSEEGRRLSEELSFCLWLWQRGKVNEARDRLRLWWTEIQSQDNFPETAARLVAWYMLGLGMFAEIAHVPSGPHLTSNTVAVASWFNGSPLPRLPQDLKPDLLVLLTQWSQYLTRCQHPPVAVVWRSLLSARRNSETFVAHVLFAATFGFRGARLRQDFARFVKEFGIERCLPYLHFLCVAAARLRWEQEAQEIWWCINRMGVEYARKGETRELLRRNLSHIEWK
ncbi:MAG: hypothetical protein NZ749_05180 [bacterium]|nr:hypothetical protein [bacterium]